jgi:hypothetical protein
MKPLRNVLIGGALAGTALIGGAVGASLLGSAGGATTSPTAQAAADPSATQSPDQSPDQTPDRAPDWSRSGHEANGKTETLLTDGDADKATAAAEAAAPGASARRVETDAEGAAFEVHMTKPDGSIVTVKLDSDFNVTETVDGMG